MQPGCVGSEVRAKSGKNRLFARSDTVLCIGSPHKVGKEGSNKIATSF